MRERENEKKKKSTTNKQTKNGGILQKHRSEFSALVLHDGKPKVFTTNIQNGPRRRGRNLHEHVQETPTTEKLKNRLRTETDLRKEIPPSSVDIAHTTIETEEKGYPTGS